MRLFNSIELEIFKYFSMKHISVQRNAKIQAKFPQEEMFQFFKCLNRKYKYKKEVHEISQVFGAL